MSLSTDIATAVIDSTISALTHGNAPIYATAIAATALVALLALRKRRPRDTRDRNGPRELDSAVSEIFLGFQAAKSR